MAETLARHSQVHLRRLGLCKPE